MAKLENSNSQGSDKPVGVFLNVVHGVAGLVVQQGMRDLENSRAAALGIKGAVEGIAAFAAKRSIDAGGKIEFAGETKQASAEKPKVRAKIRVIRPERVKR